MTDLLPYACLSCRHRRPSPATLARQTTAPITACDQYPEGIPEAILAGAPHDELRGDEAAGKAYELDPERAPLAQGWRDWRELVTSA